MEVLYRTMYIYRLQFSPIQFYNFIGISLVVILWKFSRFQEQFLIMKPNEITTRSFKISLTTNQAAKYICAGIFNA